tara:strand:- start:386 stop:823 length:438 start_codon:yes stop_codon:yes gene_type:complete
MTKISGRTAFYKKLFPVFWFGLIAAFLLAGLWNGKNLAFFLPPIAMAVFGYLLIRHYFWSLVDEVFDCGDHLLVRNRKIDYQIPFSQIADVSIASLMISAPERITLRLNEAVPLGSKVIFCLPPRMNRFAAHPVVSGLVARLDKR